MLSETEYLLVQLGEECAEVQQRIAKALRFGLSEVQFGERQTNATRIMGEFTDMLATAYLLSERARRSDMDFQLSPDWDAIVAKQEKVAKYMYYAAHACETLEPPGVLPQLPMEVAVAVMQESRLWRKALERLAILDAAGWGAKVEKGDGCVVLRVLEIPLPYTETITVTGAGEPDVTTEGSLPE